jgi:probable rRNA maturation factor
MKGKTYAVQFHYLTQGFSLKHRTALKAFILNLLKEEGKEADTLNYIFCDDEYLLGINRQYLNHDTYTDIVTFELSEKGEPLVSDIYISVERVKANAQTFGTNFTHELHRVIFHGALHLSGYKDKNKEQAKLMRSKEEEYLNRYFVPRNTVSQRNKT